jgi:hypothetical protein
VFDHLFVPIAAAAVSMASIHALAPDHWMPLATLARNERWSLPRTARITAACGAAHVSVSVVLGLVAMAFGIGLFDRYGAQLESFAGIALISFGIVYAICGLRHAAAHLHGHRHAHYDHIHGTSRVTPWTVFLLFAADPCLAIFPLMFLAAPLGWGSVAGVVVLYQLATIVTMLLLVLPATSAAKLVVRGAWMHRYGDAAAGMFIAAIGIAVGLLGW